MLLLNQSGTVSKPAVTVLAPIFPRLAIGALYASIVTGSCTICVRYDWSDFSTSRPISRVCRM